MSQLKEYLLDENGKAHTLHWQSGKKTPIPFYVQEFFISRGSTECYSIR